MKTCENVFVCFVQVLNALQSSFTESASHVVLCTAILNTSALTANYSVWMAATVQTVNKKSNFHFGYIYRQAFIVFL